MMSVEKTLQMIELYLADTRARVDSLTILFMEVLEQRGLPPDELAGARSESMYYGAMHDALSSMGHVAAGGFGAKHDAAVAAVHALESASGQRPPAARARHLRLVRPLPAESEDGPDGDQSQ